ncbi:hypothetical protein GCM10011348_12480 [Marinobacterium nitratireducens]|uniref:DUF2092 domain-containing protein n=1 Tax=Marinobacterium nitratireducens TaxID=518897 RepID=A0A918DQS0_9GAMM|nr:DUF2092 domain-containing protein [Marinobacterium nitratireducens]GGO79078.1 hypothetical protein GCM10011348_12480 [Marinobacterium nitratireducens]
MTGRLFVPVLLSAAAYTTGCATQAAQEPQVDPATAGVLLEACTRLREAPAFSVRIDTSYDLVMDNGRKIQLSRRDDVALARPDQLSVRVTDDIGERAVYYSGSLITEALPERGIYASSAAPESIDAMLDRAAEEGVVMPFEDLLRSRPCGAFADAIETGAYLGLHYVDGDWRHHLQLTTEEANYQVWVSDLEAPTIDKVVVDVPKMDGAPQLTAVFSDWNFAPAFEPGSFRFTPDESMQQVGFPIRVNGAAR